MVAVPPGNLLQMIQSISTQLDNLQQNMAAMREDQTRDRAHRLRNVVVQLLLYTCGAQSFRETSSTWYQNMLADRVSQLPQLAQKLGLTAAELAEQANTVITRQNGLTHPASLAALEQEIEEVRGLITIELEGICPQECRLVRSYEIFKCFFPERFC
ncbi:hypothetical protein VOLCADRAFT_100187 [Volvox carteri f. nagariensis]|uniref:Uncharacterized protein n=1 Tax=Volvox carteri f. nagariensis TaxID=3068 RepID=D8UJM4_VOLCA|nr:uncharacterized protein VOLCADRAFT_100187 [Volvox carteri f. nagariensis]EFJ40047.1 hypothetical protein VOLCADRAFT_100187 [Volvox carteri f. nagariensis]|eukprot:XP_002958859.1 hypothetical protein VOLCADRAFT_100187 [Volvox carteri f. nagariensis]